MNRDETSRLLRVRAALTSQPYGDEAITAWHQALPDRTLDECKRALISAARDHQQVTLANVEARLTHRGEVTARPAPVCITCQSRPAEPARTRCGPCQTEMDERVSRGVHDPAMAEAVAAAHRRSS